MLDSINASLAYDGDLIASVQIKRGANIRPLWAKMESLHPEHMILWADRFDSLCPIASEWALCQALEASAKIKIPKRAQFVRTILCEINRLVWLTTYLGRFTHALGQRGLTQHALLLREQVYQRQEELTGGRILPQAFNLGGCRRELAIGDVQKVRQFIQGLRFSWEKWLNLVADDPLVRSRLTGLLVIPHEYIERMSWWGVVGKAGGVNYDSRRHRPHGAYPFIDFTIPTRSASDAHSRFEVAIDEINNSLSIIENLLRIIPSEIEPTPEYKTFSPGFYFGSAESAKGPVISALEVTDKGVIASVRLFTSGQRVWPTIDEMFEGTRVEDFQLALASLGLDPEEAEL
ncbi:MAG: hypothetical protein SGI74_08685 [Oligoflexia bacterium]|nr:hypothetical protein [Oligoflexia bacterium]